MRKDNGVYSRLRIARYDDAEVAVVINRIDELSERESEELLQLLQTQHAGTPVLKISAKSGTGFEALIEFVEQRGRFGQRLMDVDYDTYAVGEAELGWLNSSLTVTADLPFALDALLVDIISRLQTSLAKIDAEPAHLKAIGMADGLYGVANLVSSLAARTVIAVEGHREAQLVVNARVATA
jgi:Fe2+ transport system protein B